MPTVVDVHEGTDVHEGIDVHEGVEDEPVHVFSGGPARVVSTIRVDDLFPDAHHAEVVGDFDATLNLADLSVPKKKPAKDKERNDKEKKERKAMEPLSDEQVLPHPVTGSN